MIFEPGKYIVSESGVLLATVIDIKKNPERTFVSSSLVKEVARLGRDISQFVPPNVAEALKGKFS